MAYKNDDHNDRKHFVKSDLFLEHEAAKASLKKKFALKKILGKSRAIMTLLEKIAQVASCDVNVLITGESGVGKELVARAIHYSSPRGGKPFVPVNCGAIPESIFENELFGHVKGAFTDASFRRKGLVAEAEGGTLFLDEIGTISPFSQVKLLRLLQDREYKPLGEPKPCRADIRIVTATNRELLSLVKDCLFRDDLYYRLNIVTLHIPPLRERKGDIPILVDHFLAKYAREYGKAPQSVTKGAMNAFCSYSWPGNVRELENKVQQLVVTLTSPEISESNVQLPLNNPARSECDLRNFNEAKKKAIEAFEKDYLVNLLTEHGGDVANAAKGTGKNRTALWNLLKKHNLSPKQFR
ncbi:MAG: sigma-54 dependent transcriptional regulator [Deltaproteobacteria bacterium]|nr:sigma-54 dependent transcriptional regulator [Deltaproteobacteria bacterium]